MIEFKGSHFERDVILWGVRWYVAYPIIRFPGDHFGLAIFGHQWKPARLLMVSRSLARAAHLWPMMSSSSSMVATCLLTMGSSTSAHNVSAGCSSGV